MKNKNIVTLLLLLSPIFVFSFMNFDCSGCNGKDTSVTPEPPSGIPICVISTDGGVTWETLLTDFEVNLLFTVLTPARASFSTFLCTGYDTNGAESIYRTTDAGISWTKTTVPGPLYGIDTFFGAYNYLWDITIAVGIGKILKSTNVGEDWAQINSPTTRTLNAVAFYPGVTGSSWEVTAIAVGNIGTIIRTTDMGETWTSISSGTTSELEDVCTFHPRGLYTFQDTAVIVGKDGTILITTDLGLNWIQQPFPQNVDLKSVAFNRIDGYSTGGRFGLIGGVQNSYKIIYKTTDGGATWTEKSSPAYESVDDISINHATGSIFAVSKNKIIKSVDNGESWTAVYYATHDKTFYSCYTTSFGGGTDVIIAVGEKQ